MSLRYIPKFSRRKTEKGKTLRRLKKAGLILSRRNFLLHMPVSQGQAPRLFTKLDSHKEALKSFETLEHYQDMGKAELAFLHYGKVGRAV